MTTLSAIIVTKNEAKNIEDCLKSVKNLANEIIVFDSGSTDNTVKLAKQHTDLVFETDWPGDGPQKNRAIAKANCEWILCLDADERLSLDLSTKIKDIINSPDNKYNGFEINYKSSYLGKIINYGDWRGEKHLRLFKKSCGKFTEAKVHCYADIPGNIGYLKEPIIHHPFQNLETLLHKLNDYSTGSALIKFNNNKKANLATAISHGVWTFLRGYIIKLGFLDGKHGFMLALSNAHGTYYRYLKLMLLNQTKTNHG